MASIINENIIKITNPDIIAFYQENSHLDIETLNLLLIELIKTSSCAIPVGIKASVNNGDYNQTNDLVMYQTKLSDSIHKLSKQIISQYIDAKTQYIEEFKSINCGESDTKSMFLENNSRFVAQLTHILNPLVRMKSMYFDKITNIKNQFYKIINANIESVLSKDTIINTKDYIANFETNSAQMIQTIQQIILDFVADKQSQTDKTVQLINTGDETASKSYYRTFYEINDALRQFKTDNSRSYSFEMLLSQIFSTASISQYNAGFTILRGDTKPLVYVESHEMRDRNISIPEIKDFAMSTQSKSSHGIVISQYTGITSKPNFHIEIVNNRVIIYIHQMEFSQEKLQMATDMIDAIAEKLGDFNTNSDIKYSVPKDMLDEINREYQSFVLQKETIANTLKENYKKTISQLEEMKFASLDKFLSTRYSSCKKQGFTCDLCNQFHVGTLKGLAAHKRGCYRKISRETTTANLPTISKQEKYACEAGSHAHL
jgi:hypothetical protein